jgi:hypothetical protein
MFIYILSIFLITSGLFLASNSPILPTILAIDDSMTGNSMGNSTGNATESTEDDDNFQQNGTISRKHN